MTLVEDLVVKRLGRVDYLPTWQAMRSFTANRNASTPDEFWLLEHAPVYTVGQGASVPQPGNDIPVLKTDRGGDITYHGPGQVVLYTLVDLARRDLKVKRFVWLLEEALIDLIGRRAERKSGAPGVYIEGAKIAALGIRVVRGRTYHGLALNVDMDLSPFAAIAPCGYPGLAVTQMKDWGFNDSLTVVGKRLVDCLVRHLDA